jgi:hypothetical protein
MNGNQNITATFEPSPRNLAVTILGSGAAVVTSSPAGINCNELSKPDCDAGYAHGTAVTLTAAEAPNATAAQWSGCGNVTAANECEVTMDRARGVTATVMRIDKVINPRTPGECEDGIDNDGDGLVDYPPDRGCSSSSDDESGDPAVSFGPTPTSVLRPGGLAAVTGAIVAIRSRCLGTIEPCTGVAQLFARARSHRNARHSARRGARNVLIGRGRYSVGAGKSEVIHLQLNSRGKALLTSAGNGALKATLTGPDLRSRVVRLKRAGNARRGQISRGGDRR